MYDLLRNRASFRLRALLLMVSAATLFSIWACGNNTQPSAAQSAPKNFASPDDAGKGLFEAAKSGNQEAVLAIFGPANKETHFYRGCSRGQSFACRICPGIPSDEPMAETG